MTATRLTLLPKEHPTTHLGAAAGHPLCLHNYKGRGKMPTDEQAE